MPSINVTSASLAVTSVSMPMPGVKVTVTATVDKTGILGAVTVTSQVAKVDATAPHNPTNVGAANPMMETTPGTYTREDVFSPMQLPGGTVILATVSATATTPTGDTDRTAPKTVPQTTVAPPFPAAQCAID
jgi:hypothetical protein